MRRLAVLVVVMVLLVAAVLLVRPGSRAPDESLVGLSSPPSVEERPAVEAEDVVALGPSDLDPGLVIAGIAVSPVAVGPLVLGQRQDDLADVGWSFRYGSGGCVRLAPVRVGEVAFSGWVVDGLLVSAQVEMTNLSGRTSPTALGFTFGRPLSEADDFSAETLTVGRTGLGDNVEVGVGSRVLDGARVVVSDLGTYGVRYLEVRAVGAPDCAVGPSGLAEQETPTMSAMALDFVGRLPSGQVGPDALVVGARVQDLRTPGSPWADLAASLDSAGCERLETAGTGATAGTTELFLLDGVVVGQRHLAAADESPGEPVVWAPEDGTLVYRTQQEYGRSGSGSPDAPQQPSTTGVVTYTAHLVPALDTAVVTAPPVLLEETTGEVCTPPA